MKSFADICLEDAKLEGFDCHLSEYVPELARRLKKACEMLKQPKRNMDMLILADELETFPEGEK